ncbi:hypothetical protein [Microbacterium stercoris]|uniref:Uncharacterized protein n=1 Tax=Microbacterium stercoris TaxID=2820289 RepID=A0A939QIC2_9MICO|nr:hypothetical protein [Microbacterium stercoris]MBO3662202.1 hypothetical protein [Microbacterium stercoris]
MSGTLSASDSESSVADSVIQSMSQVERQLTSESAAPSPTSRIGSLLASLNIFGNRK